MCKYLLTVLQLVGLIQQMGNDENVTIPLEVPFDIYQDPKREFSLYPLPHFERKLILGSFFEYQLEAVWKAILGSRLST